MSSLSSLSLSSVTSSSCSVSSSVSVTSSLSSISSSVFSVKSLTTSSGNSLTTSGSSLICSSVSSGNLKSPNIPLMLKSSLFSVLSILLIMLQNYYLFINYKNFCYKNRLLYSFYFFLAVLDVVDFGFCLALILSTAIFLSPNSLSNFNLSYSKSISSLCSLSCCLNLEYSNCNLAGSSPLSVLSGSFKPFSSIIISFWISPLIYSLLSNLSASSAFI